MPGSINYGIQNIRAAEKVRGCVFNERFENTAEVVKNGGLIGSGVTILNNVATFNNTANAYIQYHLFKSAQNATFILNNVIFTTNSGNAVFVSNRLGTVSYAIFLFGGLLYTRVVGDSARGGVAFNPTLGLSYDIAVVKTAANTAQFYINGVALGASFATSGSGYYEVDTIGYTTLSATYPFDGSMKEVYFFNAALSSEEILAYYNGTMWNYMKNAVLVMDGRLRNYDPTNIKVLDVSGNGNHITLGDGTTASTYPTKLNKIGYSFVTNNYMRVVLPQMQNVNEFTISAQINKSSNGAPFFFYDQDKKYFGIITNGANVFLGQLNKYTPLVALPFAQKDIARNIFITLTFNKLGDGGTGVFKFYVDGKLLLSSTGGTPEAITTGDVANNLFIGGTELSKVYVGEQKQIYIHKTQLNPTQIIDLQLSINPNSTE